MADSFGRKKKSSFGSKAKKFFVRAALVCGLGGAFGWYEYGTIRTDDIKVTTTEQPTKTVTADDGSTSDVPTGDIIIHTSAGDFYDNSNLGDKMHGKWQSDADQIKKQVDDAPTDALARVEYYGGYLWQKRVLSVHVYSEQELAAREKAREAAKKPAPKPVAAPTAAKPAANVTAPFNAAAPQFSGDMTTISIPSPDGQNTVKLSVPSETVTKDNQTAIRVISVTPKPQLQHVDVVQPQPPKP